MSDVQKWVVMAFIGMIFGAALMLWATSMRTQGGIWVPCLTTGLTYLDGLGLSM